MTKDEIIKKLKELKVKKYLKDHQMSHIWLAGSYIHGTQKKTSDIDIVYEFQDIPQGKDRDRGPIGASFYLKNIFNKDIDIIDKDCIKPRAKESILSSMEPIW